MAFMPAFISGLANNQNPASITTVQLTQFEYIQHLSSTPGLCHTLASSATGHWAHGIMELSFPCTFAPMSTKVELSLPGTFAPRSERNMEISFRE